MNSPHKGPVTRKMFPFDNVIMKIPIHAFITHQGARYLIDKTKGSLDRSQLQRKSLPSIPLKFLCVSTVMRIKLIYSGTARAAHLYKGTFNCSAAERGRIFHSLVPTPCGHGTCGSRARVDSYRPIEADKMAKILQTTLSTSFLSMKSLYVNFHLSFFPKCV